jgi:alternate signal-mediated exported protein
MRVSMLVVLVACLAFSVTLVGRTQASWQSQIDSGLIVLTNGDLQLTNVEALGWRLDQANGDEITSGGPNDPLVSPCGTGLRLAVTYQVKVTLVGDHMNAVLEFAWGAAADNTVVPSDVDRGTKVTSATATNVWTVPASTGDDTVEATALFDVPTCDYWKTSDTVTTYAAPTVTLRQVGA